MNNGIRKNILAPSFRVFLNNKSKRTTHAYSCTTVHYSITFLVISTLH